MGDSIVSDTAKELLKVVVIGALAILLGPTLDLFRTKDAAIRKDVQIINDSTAAQEVYIATESKSPLHIRVNLDTTGGAPITMDTFYMKFRSPERGREFEASQYRYDTAFYKDRDELGVPYIPKGLYTLLIPIHGYKR